MAGTARLTRRQLSEMDVEGLMLDEKFLRFLSTVRLIAGIETVAYGPDDRHLHFAEGRRSLWCDILRTAELAQPDALLRILTEEMKATKETTNGRRTYNRLDTNADARGEPDAGSGIGDFLDYGAGADAEG